LQTAKPISSSNIFGKLDIMGIMSNREPARVQASITNRGAIARKASNGAVWAQEGTVTNQK
jgi:hypothetical protein